MGDDTAGIRWPLVSVIMPTYNMARYLGDAIKDILAQDFNNFELIVVNDGSDDSTAGVARAFEYSHGPGYMVPEPKLTYLEHDRNRGEPAALMTGIRHARAPFWSFVTSDCRYERHFLSTIWKAIDNESEVAYAYGNFYFIDGVGNTVTANITISFLIYDVSMESHIAVD